MDENGIPTMAGLVITLVIVVIGFMFGSIYGEKKIRRLAEYCVDKYPSQIIGCMEQGSAVDPADYGDVY